MSTPARKSNWPITAVFLVAMGLLLGVPFAMRPEQAGVETDLELVIISPHDDGVKEEFERAFTAWHQAEFGQPVRVVWLNVGGGGNIEKYVASGYTKAFTDAWGGSIPPDLDWPAIDRPPTPGEDPKITKARQLLAGVGADVDVFFGGGDFVHTGFKWNGWLAALPPSDNRPWARAFTDAVPADLDGVRLYDPDGYWYGACLSRFGLLANRRVCEALNVPVPQRWSDLAEPRYAGQLALADPNMSGSIRVCYEMVLQTHGWDKGWVMLTNIAANARYFGSGSTQAALDVSRSEAAAGMIIDYYGRQQVDYVGRGADGEYRLVYQSPLDGTATTPDPISVFRGAPHRELAERFVQFVLSPEGQRLWMGKVGAPGGPQRSALLRPPILPQLYDTYAEHLAFGENPYVEGTGFNMNGRMLGKRFALLAVMMKAAFIANADLLREAAAVARARPGSSAWKLFNTPLLTEAEMWAKVEKYEAATPGEQEQIGQDLYRQFKQHYERVLAEAGES